MKQGDRVVLIESFSCYPVGSTGYVGEDDEEGKLALVFMDADEDENHAIQLRVYIEHHNLEVLP